MKYLFALIFTFWIHFYPQDAFHIYHIKGAVVLQKNGKLLKIGDSIHNTDKVIYKSKEAVVYAVSEHGKRYKGETKGKVNEIVTVLGTFFPVKGSAATRDVLFPSKEELQQFFAGSDSLISEEKGFYPQPFLIINQLKYQVLAEGFEQNDSQYFYLKYTFAGKSYQIKLPHEGDKVIISKDIFKMDGKVLPYDGVEDIQVLFHKESEDILLGGFRPIFIEEEVLKNEIKLLLEYLKKTGKSNKELIKEDVIPHLQEAYGYVYPANLKEWLKETFELKE
jgi:hypothetical protein